MITKPPDTHKRERRISEFSWILRVSGVPPETESPFSPQRLES
jgi:hypothetical protein